jgi:hypothetical protein
LRHLPGPQQRGHALQTLRETSHVTSTAGLDLSLTGTGVCVSDPRGGRALNTLTSKPATSLTGTYTRLTVLTATITDLIPPGARVAVEGPSLHSRYGHQHDRSGLWWLVYHALTARGCTVISIPPTTRAKYATGKGNAGKDVVLAATVRRHPGLPITSNDLADAVILDDIVNRLAGHPTDGDMPALNLTALKGLQL